MRKTSWLGALLLSACGGANTPDAGAPDLARLAVDAARRRLISRCPSIARRRSISPRRSDSDANGAAPDGVAFQVAANPSGNSITVAGTVAGNIVSGDKVLLIDLQGAVGDGGSVGKYEVLDVTVSAGSTLTVAASQFLIHRSNILSIEKMPVRGASTSYRGRSRRARATGQFKLVLRAFGGGSGDRVAPGGAARAAPGETDRVDVCGVVIVRQPLRCRAHVPANARRARAASSAAD